MIYHTAKSPFGVRNLFFVRKHIYRHS